MRSGPAFTFHLSLLTSQAKDADEDQLRGRILEEFSEPEGKRCQTLWWPVCLKRCPMARSVGSGQQPRPLDELTVTEALSEIKEAALSKQMNSARDTWESGV